MGEHRPYAVQVRELRFEVGEGMKPKYWFLLFVVFSVFYPTPFLILVSLAITALLLALMFSPFYFVYVFLAALTDDEVDPDERLTPADSGYYPGIL